VTAKIATGLACQPLADGNVLIEFYDKGGETISTVVVSADALRHLPILVRLTLAVMEQGAVAGADQQGGEIGLI
jgi:hypothetical protein